VLKVNRTWHEKKAPEETYEHTRYYISSIPIKKGEEKQSAKDLGEIVRGHWCVENCNHHKRDDSVWQEDRHRHRRANIAQNLALTRNALLAIIPFDDERNLPELISEYRHQPSQAIKLILHSKPIS
jgi:predicted transposase YbfD/YdcC